MLSRIADSLFWLNRYSERIDSFLRLTYVHYILSLDKSESTGGNWKPVLELCGAGTNGEVEEIEDNTSASLRKIIVDDQNTNSIRCLVNRARENARGAQDHITKEVWEVVNQMYHLANQPIVVSKLRTDQAVKMIEAFTRSSVLYAGITDNTMARGLGWNFMMLGKYIERCLQTIAITNKQLERISGEDVSDILQWRYLLLCLSGYEMHLKTYRSQHHTDNVLDQIILNENFPRSVIYSLVRIKHYLDNIMIIHEEQNNSLVRSFGRLYSSVKYMDFQPVDFAKITKVLNEIKWELSGFSTKLSQYYFSYS